MPNLGLKLYAGLLCIDVTYVTTNSVVYCAMLCSSIYIRPCTVMQSYRYMYAMKLKNGNVHAVPCVVCDNYTQAWSNKLL